MITAMWSASFPLVGMGGDVGASSGRNDLAFYEPGLGKARAAAGRRRYCENATWLDCRAHIANPSMHGEPLAVLSRLPPRKELIEYADGRVKCAFDRVSTNRACSRRDNRQVAALLIDRLQFEAGPCRIHMVAGAMPVRDSYDAEKADWVPSNPWSNPGECEAAMRSMTERTGV